MAHGGGAGAIAAVGPAPWFVRGTVLLHSIALPASILVATLFWTLVYIPGKTKVYAVTYFVHGARQDFAEHFHTFRVAGGTDPHRPSTPQIISQRLRI